MSKRAQLRELATAFQQTPAPKPDATESDDADLDAQIAKRIAMAKGEAQPGSPNTVEPDSEPEVSPAPPSAAKPSRKTAATDHAPQRLSPRRAAPSTASADATAPVPRPVVRAPGDRSRIAVDVPVQFEHRRKSAKKMGMSATALVLAALREHGEQLSLRAQSGLLPVRAEAVKRWTLLLTEAELAELDRLVDEVEVGLGRRSRSAVVGLLMDELPGSAL